MHPSPRKTDPNDPIDTKALHAGDASAFDRLYAQFAPRVLGYLMRLTGKGRAETEDLVQETFLAAYAGRTSFAQRSGHLAWLLGIARRRWRDDRRSESVRPAAVSLEAVIEQAQSEDRSVAEQTIRKAMLERALCALPETEREAVLLVIVQQLTYREAAQITGEPVGTVKWRVHAATKSMRALLSEEGEAKP
jgi:RNA polymerase sigma-70 factor, ECF subfamily